MICVIISLLRPRQADLKMIFERTERLGLIPFRRLLLIENIIDLGDLNVRSTTSDRGDVRVIRLDVPWEQTLTMIRQTRHSRYPVIEQDGVKPVGIIHVKDLVLDGATGPMTADRLKELAGTCLELPEDLPLEEALAQFQAGHGQMAIVVNPQTEWTGIITNEDVLEEIVGKIGDEFDPARADQFVSMADALSPGRIVFQLRARSMSEAIQEIIARIPREELPADPQTITRAVLQREQAMTTYLGKGLAIPHGRLDGIDRPVLAFARSDEGVPLETTNERAELFFLLLTPSGIPRIQVRLLADIASLFHSEYVTERLRKAATAEAVIEAIRAGQQVAID